MPKIPATWEAEIGGAQLEVRVIKKYYGVYLNEQAKHGVTYL
jgi:hypothetical protein